MAFEYTKKQEEALFKSIFSGTTSVFNLPVNLYRAINKNIFEGVTNGFGGNLSSFGKDTLEHSILTGYEANTHAFSGAKTFQQVKDMSISLFDKGKKVPFKAFEKQASKIFDIYNKTWLKAEYNTAINQALAGSKWAEIEKDKFDFPLLRYQTVNDGRVRPQHVTLDNIVKPVNSPFWDTNYPPNGWNCRCIVTKHEEGELKETDLTKIKDLEKPNKLFRMNSGKDKIIFDPKHPYFKVEDRFKVMKKEGFGLPKD
jgi:SPP1 gp7 family putative phage head morphogenesis protein